ncbi:MAG: anthranilate synthase component I [Nitrosospira sp.]|nr:anthranilate synthase component I [Nitrosospira sp.]MDW7642441.1 anthranilate synthase component I [Nitrosomonadaceae bacterium]MBI0407533.1 anthranilate synthase component I [Nitrosospira sp.]MBI0414812.1 anthranilate synthase component I [Nitrosospira sp.]MBI0416437.1 anthranilate synthase component I [Nitrosospira sp.]
MTETEFNHLAAQGYNRIPVVLETFADLDTPLSIYLKLANRSYSYLLESVQGGERFGRYSFIGLPAVIRIEVRGNSIHLIDGTESKITEMDDPLVFIESYLSRFKAAPYPGLPRFCGGLVGYFAYDVVRYIEKKLSHCALPDVLDVPDILLLLSEELAVVDNLSGKLYLIVYADPGRLDAYQNAQHRLKELLSLLRQPLQIPIAEQVHPGAVVSEFSKVNFIAAVERIKRYILDGDIMQTVLSQRTSKPYNTSPLSLYRALRNLNPSPYMFYYHFGGFYVVGTSPEILVRLEGETVTVRPIAGTRPRGETTQEDLILAADLLADPKERAEHVMLMDLGRNDIGRVAQTGTVTVTENMQIENYSHVMHIVSNVDGKLKPGLNAMDVLRATFPAGTVSGAPKVRAMQVIDELEISKRGIYAGAVGYLGFNGDMDLAIAIRTGIVKDGMLHVQAGAGIVADSVPENEWIETQNKARALLLASEIAESGLDSKVE